ncbi:phosphatase PAP2 family protein [Paractinoplanes hotanensis]|uniref:Phosphatase PAP2 family protein n=1 Tax=Paractinoplanes hotanensis TaxID=2906497 RepID=A0ABT0XVK8_9ACTN|nr:phosphatase PAP2 family protein [Actinoplanes hotanensis]MCM4077828.1 phosphatase PAP2 family protein [Actinoplanes hotanensis]
MPPLIAQIAKRLLLPVTVLFGVMVGLGLLVTRVVDHSWPLTVEDDVNRSFEAHRDGPLNVISEIVSLIGSTPVIIAVTGVAAAILYLKFNRWREPLYLCLGVTAQALVFFFTTLVIDRERPTVRRMDDSPPTSSFPSGHTSAAVALYVGLALLLFTLLRHTWAKRLAWLLILIPIGVATARLYRGMHHPTDVLASFLNGVTCVVIMFREVLNRAVKWAVPSRFRPGVRRVAH